jgi:probable F420-dependent oxidoreductase
LQQPDHEGIPDLWARQQRSGMKIGLIYFPTDLSMDPAEFARAAEARGFESVWLPEHTHIPVSRETPYPQGGELPDQYRRIMDPFVALAAAASVTSRIRLATGVCLVAERDVIVLAKEVATLDRLCGGRFTFGIGVGWNLEAVRDHGVDPRQRRALVREKVLAMQRLWSDEVASFEGELVRVSPSWSWPKPVQHPHPPIVMGAAGGPITMRYVAEFCDGFMPNHLRRDLDLTLSELRNACEAAGRDPATVELGASGVPCERAAVEGYAAHGFARVVLAVPHADRDETLRALDQRASALAW